MSVVISNCSYTRATRGIAIVKIHEYSLFPVPECTPKQTVIADYCISLFVLQF